MQPCLATNARGEILTVPAGQALQLLPDSSLALAPADEPNRHYIWLDGGHVQHQFPAATLPTGELPHRQLTRQKSLEAGRSGPLGFGLQIQEEKLGKRLYLDKNFDLKSYQRPGPKAVVDARHRRLTGYAYGQIFPFHDGLALVNDGGRHGFINQQGKLVILPQFGFGSESFRWGRAIVTDAPRPHDVGNQALIDTQGRFVIPLVQGQRLLRPSLALQPDTARPPLLVRHQWGDGGTRAEFYTYDGKRAFPDRIFTDAQPFEQGRAWVQCRQKVGLLNERGQFVVQCEYDELKFEQNRDLEGGAKHRSELSELMIRALEDEYGRPISTMPDTAYLRARRDGQYGYLRRSTGRLVIPTRYDSVQWGLRHGIAFLRRAGQVYMVNLRGQEVATGARRTELLRNGQRFFQLARAGQWCVVDTAGRQRLLWRPDSEELVDFHPSSDLAIVRDQRSGPIGKALFNLVGPAGLLSPWAHSLLLFWGPTEILGELTETTGPRYVVYDHRGRERRRLDYRGQWRYPDAGLAMLFRPDDATAGTLVVDLVAGGVRHQLPSAWADLYPTAPEGLRTAAGKPYDYVRQETGSDERLRREKPVVAWPGLLVTVDAHTPNQWLLGYLDRHGRRFWED